MSVERLPAEIAAVLRTYRGALADAFGERLVAVRLFGSRARGEARPDSDIDVAVVIRGLSDAELDRAIDLAYEAWWSTGRQSPMISPLVWSEERAADALSRELRIAEDIEREGIPL
ncbi:MAG TPA: nucleotidyltransferase domain-containing protein [Polyangia bacterium]|jgi:predicted nucleotidyltransferase